jgi:hypothetical protein
VNRFDNVFFRLFVLRQRLHKEILVWQMLKHENVLPLLGITFDVGRNNPMGMVSPWVENGDLSSYLNHCGAALALWDRLRIVSNNNDISNPSKGTYMMLLMPALRGSCRFAIS